MIIRQKYITREDVQANPTVLYVFGDNVARFGKGGQAGEMRGEPNAVGVVTKWMPDTQPGSYFSDGEFDRIKKIIDDDVLPIWLAVDNEDTVIIPMDGIGTGLSELEERAPKIYEYIRKIGLGPYEAMAEETS